MTQDHDSGAGSLREDQARLIFDEGFSFSGYERDALFLGDGRRFLNVSGVSGLDSLSDGRAAVFADFDNDGDSDVFLTTLQGEAHLLFRNNVGQDRRWLRVLLEGTPTRGRDAFGAVARIRMGGRTLTKIKAAGMGYMAQHDPRLLFGLGDRAKVDAIEVTWPDGGVEVFAGPFPAGTTVTLRAGRGQGRLVETPMGRLPDAIAPSSALLAGLRVSPGQAMPDLALRTLDDRATTLSALRRSDRRAVVNIWATWCAPCLTEMRELQTLRPALAAAGVDLVGVSVDTRPDADLRSFARRAGATYPLAAGGVPVVEALYATDELFVPMSLVIDERSVIVDILPGWSATTRKRFLALAATTSR